MDRAPSYQPPERRFFDSSAQLHPPPTQPPPQIPFSDPFRSSKDPFFPNSDRSRRRGSLGVQARVWPSPPGKPQASFFQSRGTEPDASAKERCRRRTLAHMHASDDGKLVMQVGAEAIITRASSGLHGVYATCNLE